MTRWEAHEKLCETAAISNFLIVDEDQNLKIDKDTGLIQYKKKVTDIKPISDILGQVETDAWNESRKQHLDKLEKHRSLKKYQALLEDDEEDVEAEKIMSDIRNLRNEKYFNIYFNFNDDFN